MQRIFLHSGILCEFTKKKKKELQGDIKIKDKHIFVLGLKLLLAILNAMHSWAGVKGLWVIEKHSVGTHSPLTRLQLHHYMLGSGDPTFPGLLMAQCSQVQRGHFGDKAVWLVGRILRPGQFGVR